MKKDSYSPGSVMGYMAREKLTKKMKKDRLSFIFARIIIFCLFQTDCSIFQII